MTGSPWDLPSNPDVDPRFAPWLLLIGLAGLGVKLVLWVVT